jgi:hypothetical protein
MKKIYTHITDGNIDLGLVEVVRVDELYMMMLGFWNRNAWSESCFDKLVSHLMIAPLKGDKDISHIDPSGYITQEFLIARVNTLIDVVNEMKAGKR